MQSLRTQVQPIFEYYFPPTMLGSLSRWVGLRPKPDWTRYLSELKQLHDAAWQDVERAKAALEGLGEETVDTRIKTWLYIWYRQVHLDGNTLILLFRYVQAASTNEPETLTYFAALRQTSRDARRNLKSLDDASAAVRAGVH